MRGVQVSGVGGLLLCCACAAPVQHSVGARPELDEIDWHEVPPAFADTRGLELPLGAAQPGPGDRLLYRIHLQDGSSSRDWLMRAELRKLTRNMATLTMTASKGGEGEAPRELRSPGWLCDVSIIELGERGLERTSLLIPEVCMELNLFSAAQALEELGDQTLDQATHDRRVFGIASAVFLFDGWQENAVLSAILCEVVSPPSLFGALRFLVDQKIMLNLEMDEAQARECVLADRSLPGYRVPIEISVGGSTVMRLEADVVECIAPLSLGTGVLRLHGVGLSSADRWVSVDLIGGRLAEATTPEGTR